MMNGINNVIQRGLSRGAAVRAVAIQPLRLRVWILREHSQCYRNPVLQRHVKRVRPLSHDCRRSRGFSLRLRPRDRLGV